jgi:hypothetical protein
MSWDNFFIAQAGAAAGLTGLIFVAVSINLNGILAAPYLPTRALQSIILLLNILLISSLMLVSGQSSMVIGIEVIVLGVILWTITLSLGLSIHRTSPIQYKKHSRGNLFLTQIAVIPFNVAGICILVFGETGFYFLVPGILFSFSKAIIDAWVLLVEINR